MIKVMENIEIQGAYISILKAIYSTHIQQNFKQRETQAFPLKSAARQGCSQFPFLFNIVLELLAKITRQVKEIKEALIGTKEVKQRIFIRKQYDSQHRRPQGHLKTPTAAQHIQQSSRIQNQHKETLFIYLCAVWGHPYDTEVRGQILELGSHISLCEFWEWNSGHQTQRREHFYTEQSCQISLYIHDICI